MVENMRIEVFDAVMAKIEEIIELDLTGQEDKDLLQLGLDSLKMIEVIVHLESTFKISFPEEELLFEHFSTINRLVEQTLKNKAI